MPPASRSSWGWTYPPRSAFSSRRWWWSARYSPALVAPQALHRGGRVLRDGGAREARGGRRSRDLLEILDTGGHGGISVKDKINFEQFTQKEVGDTGTKDRAHRSDPMVQLVGVSTRLTTDERDRLSQIIAVVNARVGGILDADVAMVTGLQIKELLLKVDALKAYAMANNEEDFAIAYFDSGEDVLYDGLQQNNQFFGEVLKDDELMRRLLGLYVHDVYRTLRSSGEFGGESAPK